MIIKMKATSVDNMEMLFHLNFVEHDFSITQFGAGVTRIGWFSEGVPTSVEVFTDTIEFLE
ncbi:hypothetical protein [Bacillus phage vB_BanS-Thrax2]|nr:hypothetical protein [Bacillus phage vB_BanS-Thrax2]